MRNHTLMQTIARANRVYRDKVSGLIVDYVGVFRNLERALAIYGTGGTGGGERPVDDKTALVAALENAIDDTQALCAKQGVDLQPIEDAGGFERIGLLDDAVDGLVASDEHKKRFLDQAAHVHRLYKAVLPDPAAQDLQPSCVLIPVLALCFMASRHVHLTAILVNSRISVEWERREPRSQSAALRWRRSLGFGFKSFIINSLWTASRDPVNCGLGLGCRELSR